MSFKIECAAGRITGCISKAVAIRKKHTEDGASLPTKTKVVEIELDLAAEAWFAQLEDLAPGLEFMLKAMAGMPGEARCARRLQIERKLGKVLVEVHDPLGEFQFKMVTAETRGKPVLRISANGDRIRLPLRFEGAVTDVETRAIDTMMGVDALISVSQAQMDTSDVKPEGKKTSKRSKGKGTVIINDDEQSTTAH